MRKPGEGQTTVALPGAKFFDEEFLLQPFEPCRKSLMLGVLGLELSGISARELSAWGWRWNIC